MIRANGWPGSEGSPTGTTAGTGNPNPCCRSCRSRTRPSRKASAVTVPKLNTRLRTSPRRINCANFGPPLVTGPSAEFAGSTT